MITLGLVANVDTSGVYVTMPGARGVLRGPYETLQNVAVGDRVLVVTTDDGENVIVGQAAATSPRSTPASSTDNAVARFDGTTGALQGSGVTIDDGGNVTSGSVRAAKSSNTAVNVVSTGGEAIVAMAASTPWLRFRTVAEVERFALFVTGDDLRVRRFDNTGASLGDVLNVARLTGRVTFKEPTATAGIELGSGGPTITTGTGAPSHSAPNGSVYLRRDGTAATTLYIRAGGAWSALT